MCCWRVETSTKGDRVYIYIYIITYVHIYKSGQWIICVYIHIYLYAYVYLCIFMRLLSYSSDNLHDNDYHDPSSSWFITSPWFVIMIHHHICIIMTCNCLLPFKISIQKHGHKMAGFSMTFHGMFPHGSRFRRGPTWWAPPHSSCHYLLEPDKSPGRQHESHQWNCRGKNHEGLMRRTIGKPTYPTWGKGKSSSKCHFWGDMSVPWRVVFLGANHVSLSRYIFRASDIPQKKWPAAGKRLRK